MELDIFSWKKNSVKAIATNGAFLLFLMLIGNAELAAQHPKDGTGCGTATLPLYENFDGVADSLLNTNYMLDCWTRINSADPATDFFLPSCPRFIPSSVGSGNDLYWYISNNTSLFECIVMPQVDTTVNPINSLELVFNCHGGFGTPRFRIGVMSDLADTSTFEVVEEVSIGDLQHADTYEVSLAAYNGDGTYVAIRFMPDSANYCGTYMSDIALMTIPTCRHIYDLAASVENSSVDLTWAIQSPLAVGEWGVGDSLWLVQWGDTAVTVTIPAYTVEGLESDSLYTFNVSTLCTDTSAARSITVRTLRYGPVTSYPYHCDFEDSTETNAWVLINGAEPAKWVVATAANNTHGGQQSLYISSDGGLHNNGASTHSNTFATRTLHMDTGDYMVCYDWHIPQSGVTKYLRAALVPSSFTFEPGYIGWTYAYTPDSSYICLDSNTFLNDMLYWRRQVQQVHIGRAGNYTLVFYWHQGYSSYYSAAIDNVSVYKLDCPLATNLTATMGTGSATLAWEGDTTASWIATNDMQASQFTTQQSVVTSSTMATFNNLEMGTDYTLKVRSTCDSMPMQPHQHYDDLAATLTVTTLCDSIRHLPYYNDFNSLVYDIYDNTRPLVNCWTRICTYDTADVLNYPIWPQRCDNGLNNSVCLVWHWYSANDKQTIVLPPLAAEMGSVSGLRLLFKAKHNYYIHYPRFVLGVMTDPEDYTTFVPVDSVLVLHNYFEDYELSLADYDGTGRYVALHLSEVGQPTDFMNSKRVYLDNLILADGNLCHQPANIVTHSFHNRVELSWTPVGDETMWEVRYGDVDTLVVTPEITIDGLLPQTSYPVVIISVCGSENYGIPLSLSITTSCPPTELPYSCDFEEGIPSCWWKSSGSDPYLAGVNGLWMPHSGIRHIMMTGNQSGSSYLVLPLFSTPTDSLELSLWINKDSLVVGVMTDPYNLATFTPLRTVSAAQPYSYEQMHCYFPAYSGAERYLALRGPVTNGDINYFSIDDVEVDYAPSCKTPDSWRLLSYNSISATMQWYGYGCGQYRIDCTPDSGGQTVTVYSSTEMVTVTGLEPATTYNVTVRAVCGNGDTSLACGGTLTTTNVCSPVAGLVCSDITLHSVTVDWIERGLSTTWSIEYGPMGFLPGTGTTAGTNNHPYVLTGLAAGTDYDIYVTPMCIDGSSVPPASPLTITTQDYPPCFGVYNLQVDSTTYSSASFSWTAVLPTTDSLLFKVTVSDVDDNTTQIVTFTDNTEITVTGLQPTSVYVCSVQNVCDSNEGRYSEPFEIIFSTDTMLCFAPEGMTYGDLDYTSVTLDWDGIEEGASYELRLWNTVFDTIISTNQHPVNVGLLAQNVTYNAAVRTVCGGGVMVSDWSDAVSFTTQVCNVPDGLQVTEIGETSAMVRWDGDAESYNIEYGEHNFSVGTGTSIDHLIGDHLMLEGLTPGKEYDVAIKSNCTSQVSSVWNVVTFRTLQEVGVDNVDSVKAVSLYPNPAKEKVAIRVSGVEGTVMITILGVGGNKMLDKTVTCDGGVCDVWLDIKELPLGPYFVKVSGNSVNRIFKMVKK